MKLLMIVLFTPFALMAGVSYDTENAMEKVEKQIEISNKHLEKLNKTLDKMNKTLDKMCKMLRPMAFDNNGHLIEEEYFYE